MEFENFTDHVINRAHILEPYKDFIVQKLSQYQDTPAFQMHDWLKENHPDFPKVAPKTVYNYVMKIRQEYNLPKLSENERQYHGKSYLACALGRQACYLGLRTEYLNMNKFIEKIALAKIEGSFLSLISRLEKNDLIILDGFGLQPLDANSRLALLQILEERYDRKSMIIISNFLSQNAPVLVYLFRTE